MTSIALFILTLIQSLFRLLPEEITQAIAKMCVRVFLVFLPRTRSVALKNLSQAFPQLSEKEKEGILQKHIQELGITLSTIFRGEHFDRSWQFEHVKFDSPAILEKLKSSAGTTGAMIATAHLGNFELLLHSVSIQGAPINFIARSLNPAWLQAWWMLQREKSGSVPIEREGAVRGVLSALKRKEIVAVLFDQNVTREHAAFVPFFGRLCATTKIIPLMLKKNPVPLFFITIKREGKKYHARISEVEYSDLREIADTDEFSGKLLSRLHDELEARIKDHPEGWFWFHRRWKTSPEGRAAENFYRI